MDRFVTHKPVIMLGYVLRLEEGCFYVGVTKNLNERLAAHFGGTGAMFTRKHKPLDLVSAELIPGDYDAWEHSKTLNLMAKYGFNKVRGATFCSTKAIDKPEMLRQIEEESNRLGLQQRTR